MEFYNQQKYKETCHSASQNNNAIRNEERNKPLTERVEVRQYARRLLTSFREAASSVPYRQAHKQRFLMLFALSYGPFSARSLRVMTKRE
ncbi:MAG: hypothetical protein J6T63_00865 [Bacteroidales bacterium]|nr:hypothetical protein [Bacteroidales bacterium]